MSSGKYEDVCFEYRFLESSVFILARGRVLLHVPQSIVFSVRFLCIAGYCLASSLLFSAFVSIELRILCAVVHTEGTQRKTTLRVQYVDLLNNNDDSQTEISNSCIINTCNKYTTNYTV
jgi:hypothetical protein